MEQVTLSAEKRSERGSRPARRLRRQGRVPATLYGRGAEAVSVSVDARQLYGALHTDAGLNVVIDLKVDGDDYLTVAREVQRHPVRNDIIHLDFVKISLTEKIEAEVVLEPIGTPYGVRESGGVLETVRNFVTIEALPTEIPPSVTVDISALGIGDSLSVGDLAPIEGVDIIDDPETTLYTVVAPRIEVEVVEEVPEEEAELVEGEKPEEGAEEVEGEEPAEGGAEEGE